MRSAFYIRSQAPIEGMVFESCPPRHKKKNAFREERVYVLSAKDTKSTKVDEHVRGLCLHPRRVDST